MPYHSNTGAASLASFLQELVAQNLAGVLASYEPEPPVSEMAQVKLTESTNEDLITGCLDRVQAKARSFARSSGDRLEADDLMQAAMLRVCEVVAAGRLAPHQYTVAHMMTVAHFAMVYEWQVFFGEPLVSSLDVPLSDDTTSTLYDVLPDTSMVQARVQATDRRRKERSRAVRLALRRLRSSRRATALRYRYGLENSCCYTSAEAAHKLGLSSGKVAHKLGQRGLIDLRADAVLCAAVGVEVQA